MASTPRRAALAGGRMNARRVAAGTVARPLRVLVVDDHEVVQWGFRVLLAEQPWVERCLVARTGEEARSLTRTFRPDVALIDLFLAGESGAELCETIRADSPSTRVLLISGAGRMSSAAARA